MTLTTSSITTFEQLRDIVCNTLNEWVKDERPLFKVHVSQDLLWFTYLNAYPTEDRQHHNCNTCRQFIKQCGGIVRIYADLTVSTIWDQVAAQESDNQFVVVAKAMRELVRNAAITHPFYTSERKIGNHHNLVKKDGSSEIIRWDHFCLDLPKQNNLYHVVSVGTALNTAVTQYQTFKRALEEITPTAVEITLELIYQNSLYRGAEYQKVLESFNALQQEYLRIEDPLQQDRWLWFKVAARKSISIRNTVIGTLLVDISEGKNLDQAVFSFENKMDPTRFKRPRAVYTESSLNAAKQTLQELGLLESLQRRYAVSTDLTVNHVLYVNRAKAVTDVFGELAAEAPISAQSLSRVQEITLQELLTNVLPSASKVEVLFENRLANNLMSLVAPSNLDAPTFFKWDNGVTWSYRNGVADSIAERVKKAGGNIKGRLRCSLAWSNSDDLDLHLEVQTIGGTRMTHIYFGNKKECGGYLDVDTNAGISHNSNDPVENIIFEKQLPDGEYHLYVRNFQRRTNDNQGYAVEVECEGKLYNWSFAENNNNSVCHFSVKNGELTLTQGQNANAGVRSNTLWGLKTNVFHNVHTLCHSPNWWGENGIGNLHYFFLVDGVEPEEAARPFLNEYIREDLLRDHRRVFEVLGTRLTVEGKPELCGLGFSSTSPNHFYCRVGGNFTRVFKVTV